MSDQREHGVGGLEWRDLPARTPDEPLVPSTGENGEPVDETVVSPAARGENSGTGDRAGESADGVGRAGAVDDVDESMDLELTDGDTRRFGVLPAPTEWSDGMRGELTHDDPVDLSALHADDALLSALASFDAMDAPDQDPELKSLLQSWRLDVDVEPIGQLVDTDTAMATIAVGARLRKRRPRYLIPLATAAAALVVMVTGMGLAARNAVPGDALWGISQVLYTDHARSVEAAAEVRNDLHHASVAIQQGHFEEARTALVRAQRSLPAVDTSDGKANLQAQQQSLLDQLDNTTALTPDTTTSAGYGLPGGSSSASQPQAPTFTLTRRPPPQQSTSETQPVVPPVTTTEQQTEPPPPPVTTTTPTSPQTDTVGNNPAQQPPADPGVADDPDDPGDQGAGTVSTATS